MTIFAYYTSKKSIEVKTNLNSRARVIYAIICCENIVNMQILSLHVYFIHQEIVRTELHLRHILDLE